MNEYKEKINIQFALGNKQQFLLELIKGRALECRGHSFRVIRLEAHFNLGIVTMRSATLLAASIKRLKLKWIE